MCNSSSQGSINPAGCINPTYSSLLEKGTARRVSGACSCKPCCVRTLCPVNKQLGRTFAATHATHNLHFSCAHKLVMPVPSPHRNSVRPSCCLVQFVDWNSNISSGVVCLNCLFLTLTPPLFLIPYTLQKIAYATCKSACDAQACAWRLK